MPIIDVELITEPGEIVQPTLANELADRIGSIFDSPPGGTWVRVRTLARDHYGENGGSLPETLRPVFITVLKAQMPDRDRLLVEIKEITRIVAQMCNRPQENVHIFYQPSGAGRVAFGGKLVE